MQKYWLGSLKTTLLWDWLTCVWLCVKSFDFLLLTFWEYSVYMKRHLIWTPKCKNPCDSVPLSCWKFFAGSVVPFQSEKGMRWPCDRCGKDFCSSSHLKRHWILHTDFKPYKCKVCGKCFAFQWDLKKHITKHTGNKPFKCPSCPKSFNTQKERRNHNWLHTGR